MALYVIFAAGFAAGTFVKLRDLPLAAIGLGCVLLLAGHQLGVFTP